MYIKLIFSYLKIGLFGFGGGYAMLSLIQSEVVGKGYISNQTFTDIVAISQITPGPIGINSATYIGYTVTGSVIGALLTTFVVVLPPFVLTILAAHYVERHHDNIYIQGSLIGLRPVVVGLIASAALLLMNSENFGTATGDRIISILIFLVSFLLIFFTKIHPIFVVIMAGIAGYFIF
ncbi:MAG: chromate transporter [Bacteroidales bacterium]|nr:chromate transporter [Candidatus Sodaliphilus aphodohippi]